MKTDLTQSQKKVLVKEVKQALQEVDRSGQMSLFHNTIDLPETELKVRQLRAGTQNYIVYLFFYLHPFKGYTPDEIYHRLVDSHHLSNHTPLTSIRRAMSDLTKLGLLEKTKEKRAGEYGELNYCWKLLIKVDE